MSTMSTQPVFMCRRCGRPVVVTLLQTTRPDPDGTQLEQLMKGLGKIALCDFHQAQKNYYASIGRSDDWERGNP